MPSPRPQVFYPLPELKSATLLRRYKRFLADVRDDQGHEFTIYCANTGAMTGCGVAGDRVFYSTSDNTKRKYAHTWELTLTQAGHWVCVNTARANDWMGTLLNAKAISGLDQYQQVQAEVPYGEERSRIDFLLTDTHLPTCYIEVKSCTLLDEQLGRGCGFFPDAVTKRGQKHLRELMAMQAQGARAVLLFAVLHTGISQVDAARHIDADYGALFDQAIASGVEVLVCYADINTQGIALKQAQWK
ncbi:Sugar fermentation stimulation protein A [Vibrio stylophorae]|uniref:Sugar fermentation stimulation protein homolog n=1 Tax=Vibrio stylophorae TaxID=659351 RepID=A0ABM8ZQP9_9VIBR|nr:DNA/RNA nuclease SfsA [Vibrio stylophorae]CAH0532631.1 Sugar fermentation stimulation protein A [Vibrio stylophorae]